METVVSVYKITSTLITIYGYYKVAILSIDQYNKARFLFDLVIEMIRKLNTLILSVDNRKTIELPINRLNEIKKDIQYTDYKFYNGDFEWEVLDVLEIEKEMKTPEEFYYFENLVSFYTYIDENGRTVSEL